MNQSLEPPICVHIDQTNPGQFFACCGLLELADRLWKGAEGWFDGYGTCFSFRPLQAIPDSTATTFIRKAALCRLTNKMTAPQLARRNELSAMSKKQRAVNPLLEDEKKALDKLWREAPVFLHEPFNLCLDWFSDEHAGGATFKTWAGQQSVIEIACGIKKAIEAGNWSNIPPKEWLSLFINSDVLPFNFDSDLGGVGSDLDVGFSFDPLKIRVRTRPLVEFFAFVGLQRFRPMRVEAENLYQYSLWFEPLVPGVAAAAACGLLDLHGTRTFMFRLLYRTDYLKSFLPANPIGGR